MISRQVLDNGKVTSLTKCKHFGFVQRKQNASAMERGQQTNCQRTKNAKSCGVCPGTFKMSGSSAIRPLFKLRWKKISLGNLPGEKWVTLLNLKLSTSQVYLRQKCVV